VTGELMLISFCGLFCSDENIQIIALNSSMTVNMKWKISARSSCGLIAALSLYLLVETEERHEKPVRIAGILAIAT
jgi:hypothetical protein